MLHALLKDMLYIDIIMKLKIGVYKNQNSMLAYNWNYFLMLQNKLYQVVEYAIYIYIFYTLYKEYNSIKIPQIVYSTCSISPLENDGVIRQLIGSLKKTVRVTPININYGEATIYGRIILPDHESCLGWGPMYICLLTINHDIEN